MMTEATQSSWCCGSNLRIKCLIIGYLNLIASIVDIGCHVLIVFIATYGFQCDVDKDSLQAIDWPWMEPFLLIINLGTHGFYPFPFTFNHYTNANYMQLTARLPSCYPGMLHVYLVDVLNFLINTIWLRFVLSYVIAIHKKDPEPMRLFFGLSVVKLALQILYFAYQPDFNDVLSSWAFKLTDVCIASLFLMIINRYIIQLRLEKAQKNLDQPPTYIECLINSPTARVEEKKDAILIVEEKKPEVLEVKPQS